MLIGNEILTGKVRDVNGPLLARRLRARGIDLRRAVMVEDVVEEIAWALRTVASGFDHVFTSGGIGPTHDDVTVEGVAAAFGVPVEEEPSLAAMLRATRGASLTGAHLRMARVPVGTRVIHGGGLSFPLLRFRNVFLLPGVPEAFAAKLEVALPLLDGGVPVRCHCLYTTLEEGHLAAHLEAVLRAFPGVTIGSYPVFSRADYRVKVCIESRDFAQADRALADLAARLPGDAVVPAPDGDGFLRVHGDSPDGGYP